MREKRKKMPKTVCHDDRLTNRSNERMSKLSERLALRLQSVPRKFRSFCWFCKAMQISNERSSRYEIASRKSSAHVARR